MAILTSANLLPIADPAVSWAGMAYNIAIVTTGNVASGVFCLGAVYSISTSYGVEYERSMEDNVAMNVGAGTAASQDDD